MKRIPLSKGKFAKVSDQDYHWLKQWKWSASFGSRNTKWYARRRDPATGRMISMHRQIMGFPEGLVVDHLDNDGLNNMRSNLEVKTQAENMHRCPTWKRKGMKCG